MSELRIFDNGSGGFKMLHDSGAVLSATVNYASRSITISPVLGATQAPVAKMRKEEVGKTSGKIDSWYAPYGYGGVPRTTATTSTTYRYVPDGYNLVPSQIAPDPTKPIKVRWRSSASAAAQTDVLTASEVVFDLSPENGETVVSGSVRFALGGREYVDRSGSIFHSINPANNSGTLAGTINYATGDVRLTDWVAGAANSLALKSLTTEIDLNPVDEITFRVPIVPVRNGSFQLRAIPIAGTNGAEVLVTADSQGRISSPYMRGTIDYLTGVVKVRFGEPVLAAGNETQPWYDAAARFQTTAAGVAYILKPRPVFADSLRYNAVGLTYLPLDANILGLDPVRLPSDGRVPIFRIGDVVVIHDTDKTVFPGTPVVGTTLNVGRVRLSALKVIGTNGQELAPSMYTTDLDAGTVTLGSTYALGTLTLPLFAEHRIEDMAVATDVQINGRLALNRPITHNYSTNSVVSSALVIGDLQGRVFGKFSQESWTNAWADARIGNNTTSQYNDTVYPITTKNRGSTEERWALIFTGSTQFRVVGQNVGQIAIGDINTALAPLNPATNTPYFELNPLGWGSGWAAGNVLRFNTAAANYPIWVARTVLQGPATTQEDSFQVQVRGDIDRP